MIGNFYRPGKLYTTEVVRVNDHDFASLADSKIVPHGLMTSIAKAAISY
ncbi:hypothetical protein NX761_04915 [Nitrosomonas sp. PLL12]|nr:MULTISPECIES: hypothetical protein [Nitrosomonas]UVS62469.1 hypothetical protein NX761_04915 [Nitrosomonas sp. PLL12]